MKLKRPGRIALVIGATLMLSGPTGCGGDNPVSSGNRKPSIRELVAVPAVVPRGGTAQITTLASDDDDDPLTYSWTASSGTFSGANGPRVRWHAPMEPGTFRITGTVSDGTAADSAMIQVTVASASIRVDSTPPGADIYLNGVPTGLATPAEIGGVSATAYNVQLVSSYFNYLPADTAVFLNDGDLAVVNFRIPTAELEQVDTGPGLMDEIGGLTYSAGGIGVLWTARTDGTTSLRSASLVPTHSGINGRTLFQGLHFDETLTIRVRPFQPADLAFVFDNSIFIGRLIDTDVDGLIESMPTPTRLAGVVGESYAPAFSPGGTLLAMGLSPSTRPNTTDIMLAGTYDTLTVSNRVRVSTRGGNSPHFGPDRTVVFESGGELYRTTVDSIGVGTAVKLTDTGGHAMAPAVSPNGRYVAYIDDRGTLDVLIPALGVTTTIRSGVTSGRVAWAPNGRELLIADNSVPGNARLFLVIRLPIR